MYPNADRFIRYMTVMVILLGMFFSEGTAGVSAQVVGNTYSSPSFGYSMSWNDTWFVEEETSEPGFDELHLTNTIAYVSVYGEETRLPPVSVISGAEVSSAADSTILNFEVQLDAAGNPVRYFDENRAYAAYTATFVYDDGSTSDVGLYVEARTIVRGESMVSYFGVTQISYFPSMMIEFDQMLATLDIQAAPAIPETVVGEPAPVFVSGPWRVGIARAAQGTTMADVNLAAKAGKEWIIIIVDIANWSASAANLNLRDFKVVSASVDDPVRVAPASSRAVTSTLGSTVIGEDLILKMDAVQSVRIALAFSIPAATRNFSLTTGDISIPLDDVIELSLAPETLPPIALPAEVQSAEVVSSSDGRTMRILMEGETDSQRIQLIGVEPPAEGECLENDAENVLDDLVGSRILVEQDTEVTGGKIPARYVWLVNADGTRTLLNQKLLAMGYASMGLVPGTARFWLLLNSTADAAEAGAVGLWAGCESTSTHSGNATPVDE